MVDDDFEAARAKTRAAKDAMDGIVSALETQKRRGTGYDVAQSSQAYSKALDQAIKWSKKARSAM